MEGYLIVNGILFLLVGLRALLKPQAAVATPYGLVADTVDAKHYLRSSAGGVPVLVGAVLLAGPWVPGLALPGLVMAVAMLGGLVFGRAVSVMLDGIPGITPWIAGALELLGLLLGAYWLFEVWP